MKKPYISLKEIRRLYYQQEWSFKRIAEVAGVSDRTIYNYIYPEKIEARKEARKLYYIQNRERLLAKSIEYYRANKNKVGEETK